MREIKFRVYKTNKSELNGEMIYLSSSQLSEIHLTMNQNFWALWNGKKRICGNAESESVLMQFTGFKDSKGADIYEGDIIGDWNDIDGEKVQSKLQVFWSDKKGIWMVDISSMQNKSVSAELWLELEDFDYEVIGNIHQKSNVLK